MASASRIQSIVECLSHAADARDVFLLVGSLVVTGLASKHSHLKHLCARLSSNPIMTDEVNRTATPDVFFVIDAQLKSKQTVMGIPPGYEIFRSDSPNHGIVAYAREDLALVEIPIVSKNSAFKVFALALTGGMPGTAFVGYYVTNGSDGRVARQAHEEWRRIHVELLAYGFVNIYYTGDAKCSRESQSEPVKLIGSWLCVPCDTDAAEIGAAIVNGLRGYPNITQDATTRISRKAPNEVQLETYVRLCSEGVAALLATFLTDDPTANMRAASGSTRVFAGIIDAVQSAQNEALTLLHVGGNARVGSVVHEPWVRNSPEVLDLRQEVSVLYGDVHRAVEVVNMVQNQSSWRTTALSQDTWSTIEVNAEAVAVLGTARRRAGVGMRGGVIDLSKWFRQMAVASTEWTKQCLNWRGLYYLDVRMQMGKVSSANVAQRVTFVLVAACERRLDYEIAELTASSPLAAITRKLGCTL
ncbi:hypothetical protein M885DRAFT_573436 [Pelagophyceae sp. CCMP2097]|nr:hypothetical protein M885DRAFT_573436 [Pelagophyceae sp. CCMP2097]